MRRRLVAASVTAALALGVVAVVLATQDHPPTVPEESATITTAPGVRLDTSLFRPATSPAPAVILAHGFGGSKSESRGDAIDLARHGYLVLTYSARGFGHSTGQAGVDSPSGEAADVSRLIDTLAARPDVVQDGPGDPRVGISGPSYGGGISLLAASVDKRVDAIAPAITWSDLTQAFSPQSALGADARTPGVVKSGWASLFFGLGTEGTSGAGRLVTTVPKPCPGFTADICTTYADLQRTGEVDPAGAAVLAARSTIHRLPTVPTLIMQGERDTLFPLAQATTLARALHGAGTTVKLVWLRGGHDGGFGAETGHVRSLTRTWFDRWLKRDTSVDTGSLFEASTPGGRRVHRPALPGEDAGGGSLSYALSVLPGGVAGVLSAPGKVLQSKDYGIARLPASVTRNLDLTRNAVTIVNPPGAQPASISSLPGLGSIASLASGLSLDFPGQVAVFEGPTLQKPVELLGGGRLSVRLTSTTGSAVLFAKLYDVDADGQATLPDAQIAPVRLEGLPTSGSGRLVTIGLPELAARFSAGHRLRLALTTTDQAYLGAREAATYTVAAGAGTGLVLMTSPSPATGGLTPLAVAAVAALGLLLLALVVAALRRRRRRVAAAVMRAASLAITERTPPLEITGLTKRWPNGLTAVDDVTLTVAHGEILGLLGPNGAGKTTALRMVLGLIHPTAGEVRIFGTPVTPGSPALERVGAFVEGPGFLPHLSGIDNLSLWWRATGARWEEAHADEAIAIAGLGAAIERPVRSYSQGMRQRLAIAQAMLGDPDLVILDEPTNGLDPPQIVEMRRVIRSIAERGATVVLSSHLLSEVEQTCTSVAVMSEGRLVAQGSVDDVVGADKAVRIELAGGHEAALGLLRSLGVVSADRAGDDVIVELGQVTREEVLRALVRGEVPVTGMTARRALEETFLQLVSS